MYLQDLRLHDRRRLQEAFQQRCDMSRLIELNSWNIKRLCERHELIGEGGHFTAWRLKDPVTHQQTSRGALPLVYKRAHAGFDAPGGVRSRRWLEAVQLLKEVPDLVPPLLAGPAVGGEPCLLMPYGPQPFTAAAAHWQPLTPHVEALRAALGERGLAWPDVVQGCCWDGVPFIFDWSDLHLAPC